jgi:GAF domain-containing protein
VEVLKLLAVQAAISIENAQALPAKKRSWLLNVLLSLMKQVRGCFASMRRSVIKL